MSTKYDPISKIWQCGDIPKFDPTLNFGQLIISKLKSCGDQVLQLNHETGYEMTAREIHQKAIHFAMKLLENGIKYNDVVTIMACHHDNVLPIFIGVILVGAIMNPLDMDSTVVNLNNLLSVTDPKLILCESNISNKIQQSLTDLGRNTKLLTFDKNESNCIDRWFDDYKLVDLDFSYPTFTKGNDSAFSILTSSGTTGPPKAIYLSHSQVIIGIPDWIKYGKVFFSTSKLMWGTSIGGMFGAILNNSKRVITESALVTPKLAIEIIRKQNVDTFFTTPTIAANMLNLLETDSSLNISSLKYFPCAGGLLAHQLITRIAKYIPNGQMYTCYGMSEVGSIVSTAELCKKINSVGHLQKGFRVKILDASDNCLGPNQTGEICIKPPTKPLGYVSNDEANKDAFDASGFYRSGDLGYFDEDNCLFMVDRKKEIFKNNLTHITPSELENCILKFADIHNVCVVGIQQNKLDLASFWPAAVVVRNKANKFIVTEKDIYQIIENNFSDDHNLRGGIYFVDELPLSANGKVERKVISKLANELYLENQN